MSRKAILRRRVKILTWLFIIGLFLSGATAIPLRSEVAQLISCSGLTPDTSGASASVVAHWLFHIRDALDDTEIRHPFLFYGTDWLAFGHFMIALVFVGALRDPVRNRWLFDFGLIACGLVIPYAFIFGELRGIPWWWRLIDCSFGVFGFIPPWFCRRWTGELEQCQRIAR